jgi:hypothetical protein
MRWDAIKTRGLEAQRDVQMLNFASAGLLTGLSTVFS